MLFYIEKHFMWDDKRPEASIPQTNDQVEGDLLKTGVPGTSRETLVISVAMD